jgi:hypothetical protein
MWESNYVDDMIPALRHNDRIRRIHVADLIRPLLERIATAIQEALGFPL